MRSYADALLVSQDLDPDNGQDMISGVHDRSTLRWAYLGLSSSQSSGLVYKVLVSMRARER
jgi:hypothetical protein